MSKKRKVTLKKRKVAVQKQDDTLIRNVKQQTKGAYLTLANSLLIFNDKDHFAGGILGDPSNPRATIITRGLLKAVIKLFLEANSSGRNLELPRIAKTFEKNKFVPEGTGETLIVELIHRVYGLEIASRPPVLGPIIQKRNAKDTYEYINGHKFWVPRGIIKSRSVNHHTISQVTVQEKLGGSLQPSDSLNLIGITNYGTHTLAATGSACTACAACSGCAACVLCAEVNADAAAASAAGLAGLTGLSN